MSKILLVDDDFAIRLLYKEELKDEGYTVAATDDCKNLMEIISLFKPDIIIMDIMMGEFNGLDLLNKIRDVYYDMPIILCSSYLNFRYDLRSIAADYYVTKSVDLSELKFMIKMALESIEPKFDGALCAFREFKNHNLIETEM